LPLNDPGMEGIVRVELTWIRFADACLAVKLNAHVVGLAFRTTVVPTGKLLDAPLPRTAISPTARP
jgi:hypothetical protein